MSVQLGPMVAQELANLEQRHAALVKLHTAASSADSMKKELNDYLPDQHTITATEQYDFEMRYDQALEKTIRDFCLINPTVLNKYQKKIYELVMQKLRQIDWQAYVHFSSLTAHQCITTIKEQLANQQIADSLKCITELYNYHRQLVYFANEKLQQLKGWSDTSPIAAIYNTNDVFPNEKMEAFDLMKSPLEDRLKACANEFLTNPTEAIAHFDQLEVLYPKALPKVYEKLWQLCDSPTWETRPDIAHDDFGRVVFHGQHPNFTADAQVIRLSILAAFPEIRDSCKDPKFCQEQDRMRRDRRCVQVVKEQRQIFEQGFYIAPSGKQIVIDKTAYDTQINSDVGINALKEKRFDKTVIELRPDNCVDLAYEIASENPAKVTVGLLNFANNGVPGGGYHEKSGSQEEEICRRTALIAALDPQYEHQKTQFYPISAPEHAGTMGELFTPCTPIFRAGKERDYALLETPVNIAVGTCAAFHRPKLDQVNGQLRLNDLAAQLTSQKIRQFLFDCYNKNIETVILGAFGCGAFKNPPAHMAEIMMDIIQNEYPHAFKKVVFSVMKDSGDGNEHNPEGNFKPFAIEVEKAGGQVFVYSDLGQSHEVYYSPFQPTGFTQKV